MPTRREISLGMAALLAGGAPPAGAEIIRSGAVAVGRAAAREHPALLLADLPMRLDPAAIRADFAASRVVKVQGWVLARHEVLWSIGQAERQNGLTDRGS